MKRLIFEFPVYAPSLEQIGLQYLPIEFESKEEAEHLITTKFIDLVSKEKPVNVFGVEFSEFWYYANNFNLPTVRTVEEWFNLPSRCQVQLI